MCRPLRPLLLPLVVVGAAAADEPADAPAAVGRYEVFEAAFGATGDYANPYAEVEAVARLTAPSGAERTLPLFWDGGTVWRLRVSPDAVGTWRYAVESGDPGLDGKAGAFECVASAARGGIGPMPGFPRHFARADGTPFLFWGDTAWHLFADRDEERLDRAAALRYLDRRAGEGVTVVHAMLLSEAGWGNAGGPPFENLSAETLNPDYWREADLRVRHANAAGLTAGLALAWGDKGRGEPYAWSRFPDPEARRRYARYVAARYGAFDVYFLVAGEWDAEFGGNRRDRAEVTAEFRGLGDVLAAADAHGRMIGIHPWGHDGTVRQWAAPASDGNGNRGGAAWMAFGDYQQNYPDLHGRALAPRDAGKPVVNSEYAYFLRDQDGDGRVDKHNSADLGAIRHATWDLLMAGAYPITGYGTTYMGGHRDPGPFAPDDPRNDPWAEQYLAAKTVLEGLHWWRLEPHDEWITAEDPGDHGGDRDDTRGGKPRRPPAAAAWLLAEPGRHYLAYVRGTAGPVTVRLGADAASNYRARLHDPRTGEMRALDGGGAGGKAELTDAFTFTPPDARDWAVHLVNTAAPPSYEAHEKRPDENAGGWDPPALELTATIPLTSPDPSPAERARAVRGGAFGPDGWRPTDRLDRLRVDLKEGFGPAESGAVELTMTGPDLAATDGKKQHFFSLYADPTGDQFNLRNAFATVRAGRYANDAGERGVKVLWRGGAARGEKAPYAARPAWDPAAEHVWRLEFTPDRLVLTLDGERVFGPAAFAGRDPARPLRHVFLHRDGALHEGLWYGFVGPAYRELRVFREPPGG